MNAQKPGPDDPQTSGSGAGLRAARASKPVATYAIIGLTLVCFGLQFVPALDLQDRFAFVPVYSEIEPWRALTTALVHAQPNPSHVFFNMVGLYFFGSFVERSLGSGFLLVTYIVSAFGGSACTLVIAHTTGIGADSAYVGASGAVFGLLGVLLTPTRRLDRNLGGVVGFIVLNVAFLFIQPGIAWQAHLGGLVVGFVFGCVRMLPSPQVGRRLFWPVAAVLTLGLGLLYFAAV